MPAAPLRTLQRGRLFALAPSLGLPGRSSRRSSRSMERERRLERETGIEPATNSLEGCDSTTELLPPTRLAASLPRRFGGQARFLRRGSFLHPIAPREARPSTTQSVVDQKTQEGSSPHQPFKPSSAPTFSSALDARERLVGRGGFEPP